MQSLIEEGGKGSSKTERVESKGAERVAAKSESRLQSQLKDLNSKLVLANTRWELAAKIA